MQQNELKSLEPIQDLEKWVADVNRRDSDPLKLHTTIKLDEVSGRAHVNKLAVGKRDLAALPSKKRIAELIKARGLRADEEGFPTTDEHAARVIPYWASDERVDRHGDIVRQSWEFETFDKNPLLLFGHLWGSPPIGNVIDREIARRDDADYKGPALSVLALFADKATWDWAEILFRLASIGFMTSGSVGFFPGRILDVKDDNEREKLGLGRWGVVFEQNELVEWSVASVPANVGAHQRTLAEAATRGMLHASDCTPIRELARRDFCAGRMSDSMLGELDASICHLWKAVFGTRIAPISDPSRSLLTEEVKASRSCSVTPAAREIPATNPTLEAAYREASPVTLEDVQSPPASNHACRIRSIDRFVEDSFRSEDREDDEGRAYVAILGSIEVDTDLVVVTEAAFWYPANVWTADDASARCENMGGEFTEATEAAPMSEDLATAIASLADGLSALTSMVQDGFAQILEAISDGKTAALEAEDGDEAEEDDEDLSGSAIADALTSLENSLNGSKSSDPV